MPNKQAKSEDQIKQTVAQTMSALNRAKSHAGVSVRASLVTELKRAEKDARKEIETQNGGRQFLSNCSTCSRLNDATKYRPRRRSCQKIRQEYGDHRSATRS